MTALSRVSLLVLCLAIVSLGFLHWGLPTRPEEKPAEPVAPMKTAEEEQSQSPPNYLENPPKYEPESPPYPFARELAEMQKRAEEEKMREPKAP